jgi:hypothetical protein
MKKLFLSLVLVLLSVNANAEIFEVVVSKFKPGLDQKKEVDLTKSLNEFLKEQPGFKSRDVFFDEKQKMYVDLVTWKDEKSAKDAAAKAEKSPICQPVFTQIEQQGMVFLHAKKLLNFKK